MCDVSKAQMGFVVERYYQFSTQRSFSNSTPITTDLINNAAIKESIVLELDHFQRIFQIRSCSQTVGFTGISYKRWPVGLVV